MDKIYILPENPGAFGGVNKLKRALHDKNFSDNVEDIKKYLSANDAYTLTKPKRLKFPRTKTICLGIDYQHVIDIGNFQKVKKNNKGYAYVLIDIDCFSKKVALVPLKNKGGPEVRDALKKIYDGKKILFVQSDKGKEYFNRHVRSYFASRGITHFATDGETKASVAERALRTIKGLIYRYLIHNKTRTYVDVLDKIAQNYNSSYHRTIGMAPNEVNEQTEEQVYNRLFPPLPPWPEAKFMVGDSVRIVHERLPFAKGFLIGWSNEIFKITDILARHPRLTYRIADQKGETIKGMFYEEELQKITPTNVYRIEAILKKRKRNNKTQLFVKWQGFSNDHNSWIDESQPV